MGRHMLGSSLVASLFIPKGDGDLQWDLGGGLRQRKAWGAKDQTVGLFRSIHPHITEMLLQLHGTQQWLPESHPLSLFAPAVAMNLAGWWSILQQKKPSKTSKKKKKRHKQTKIDSKTETGLSSIVLLGWGSVHWGIHRGYSVLSNRYQSHWRMGNIVKGKSENRGKKGKKERVGGK